MVFPSTGGVPKGLPTTIEIGVLVPDMPELAPHRAAMEAASLDVSNSLTLLPGRSFSLQVSQYRSTGEGWVQEMLEKSNKMLERGLMAGIIGSYFTQDSESVHLLCRGWPFNPTSLLHVDTSF